MEFNTLYTILSTQIHANRKRDFHGSIKIAYSRFGQWWSDADTRVKSLKMLDCYVKKMLYLFKQQGIHIHILINPVDCFTDSLIFAYVRNQECPNYHLGFCSTHESDTYMLQN